MRIRSAERAAHWRGVLERQGASWLSIAAFCRQEDGDLFLFFNRRRNRLKVLWFTGDGMVILYKQLERGTFESLRGDEAPQTLGDSTDTCMTLRADDLRLLIEGIELSSVRRRKRWRYDEAKQIEDSSAQTS